MNYWLDQCQSPRKRPSGFEWDVFVSYRSVDRRWAISLFDMLTQVGFKVFLDQYVLVPGKGLDTQLGKNLHASGSGILVWSKRAADSTWVEAEYDLMATRARNAPSEFPFHFVIATLDHQTPPGLAGGHITLDFSEYPEGPMGADLVRLTCALSGTALPVAAVGRIAEYEQGFQDAPADIRTLANAGKHQELHDLATSENPLYATSATLPSLVIEQLIAVKKYDLAQNALDFAMSRFPSSIRLQQLRGLVLRRSGHLQDAMECMDWLYQAGHRDTETLGIYAAVEADRWEALQKAGDEHAARDALDRSRMLYRKAFELEPNDTYTGINAASKSAMLGELPLAHELARRVIKQLDQADKTRGGSSDDYWEQMTRPEALLLLGEYEQAVQLYHEVRVSHATLKGSISSTAKQVRRLLRVLEVPEKERSELIKEFRLDDPSD